MKILRLLTIAAIGTLAVSCTTTETLYRYDESTAVYTNPSLSPTLINPTIADLTITEKKVTESLTFDNNLTKADISSANSPVIEYMKNSVVSMTVKKYNADVIVAPIFDIKTSDNYMKITVTLSGYPANYKNFRNATKEDFELLKNSSLEVAKPVSDTKVETPKIFK